MDPFLDDYPPPLRHNFAKRLHELDKSTSSENHRCALVIDAKDKTADKSMMIEDLTNGIESVTPIDESTTTFNNPQNLKGKAVNAPLWGDDIFDVSPLHDPEAIPAPLSPRKPKKAQDDHDLAGPMPVSPTPRPRLRRREENESDDFLHAPPPSPVALHPADELAGPAPSSLVKSLMKMKSLPEMRSRSLTSGSEGSASRSKSPAPSSKDSLLRSKSPAPSSKSASSRSNSPARRPKTPVVPEDAPPVPPVPLKHLVNGKLAQITPPTTPTRPPAKSPLSRPPDRPPPPPPPLTLSSPGEQQVPGLAYQQQMPPPWAAMLPPRLPRHKSSNISLGSPRVLNSDDEQRQLPPATLERPPPPPPPPPKSPMPSPGSPRVSGSNDQQRQSPMTPLASNNQSFIHPLLRKREKPTDIANHQFDTTRKSMDSIVSRRTYELMPVNMEDAISPPRPVTPVAPRTPGLSFVDSRYSAERYQPCSPSPLKACHSLGQTDSDDSPTPTPGKRFQIWGKKRLAKEKKKAVQASRTPPTTPKKESKFFKSKKATPPSLKDRIKTPHRVEDSAAAEALITLSRTEVLQHSLPHQASCISLVEPKSHAFPVLLPQHSASTSDLSSTPRSAVGFSPSSNESRQTASTQSSLCSSQIDSPLGQKVHKMTGKWKSLPAHGDCSAVQKVSLPQASNLTVIDPGAPGEIRQKGHKGTKKSAAAGDQPSLSPPADASVTTQKPSFLGSPKPQTPPPLTQKASGRKSSGSKHSNKKKKKKKKTKKTKKKKGRFTNRPVMETIPTRQSLPPIEGPPAVEKEMTTHYPGKMKELMFIYWRRDPDLLVEEGRNDPTKKYRAATPMTLELHKDNPWDPLAEKTVPELAPPGHAYWSSDREEAPARGYSLRNDEPSHQMIHRNSLIILTQAGRDGEVYVPNTCWYILLWISGVAHAYSDDPGCLFDHNHYLPADLEIRVKEAIDRAFSEQWWACEETPCTGCATPFPEKPEARAFAEVNTIIHGLMEHFYVSSGWYESIPIIANCLGADLDFESEAFDRASEGTDSSGFLTDDLAFDYFKPRPLDLEFWEPLRTVALARFKAYTASHAKFLTPGFFRKWTRDNLRRFLKPDRVKVQAGMSIWYAKWGLNLDRA